MNDRHTTPLPGCATTPLAGYLKGLAVLRLVGEQRPEARPRGYWQNGIFCLESTLSPVELTRFFLEEYAPTPVVAPWNGGSGFFKGDKQDGIEPLETSTAARYGAYRETIAASRKLLEWHKLRNKPEKEAKERLLSDCGNWLPDEARPWLDAAFVMTEGGPKFPPLLGTGGNDGRLEFTNNFMQRLGELFEPELGTPNQVAEPLLKASLFDARVGAALKGAIGQFSPAAAGGANAGTGYDADTAANPWDFILMIEGAMMFAAATSKRLAQSGPGVLAYPFCVHPSAAHYSSSALSDETDSRAEMWMPLWKQPATKREIQALLAEGRAEVHGRPARNGLDFARAIAGLGVDRGISAFVRYGFQVRNGLAYFAIPLGLHPVRPNPIADKLLGDIDGWLQRLVGRKEAPGSVLSAIRELKEALFQWSLDDSGGKALRAFLAIAATQYALGRSYTWTKEAGIRPLQPLDPEWLKHLPVNESPEMRLAAALGSLGGDFRNDWLPMRYFLEPVETTAYVSGRATRANWREKRLEDLTPLKGQPTRALIRLLSRRFTLASKAHLSHLPAHTVWYAWTDDIALFIAGRTDDQRLIQYIEAFALIDWRRRHQLPTHPGQPRESDIDPLPNLYRLLRCAYPPSELKIPMVPAIFYRMAAGDGQEAARLAVRRLEASGYNIHHTPETLAGLAEHDRSMRIAAALCFPIHPNEYHRRHEEGEKQRLSLFDILAEVPDEFLLETLRLTQTPADHD